MLLLSSAGSQHVSIKALCPLNSAATIVFADREDSDDPKVIQIIEQAEAVFFAGGDQSNYVRFWHDTPVEDVLNRHIAAGKPIGGSSAGLAIPPSRMGGPPDCTGAGA